MKNADKTEREMEEFFNTREYVIYRKSEDPDQLAKEAVSLTNLLSGALSTVGQLGLTGGHFDIWMLRRKIRGFYDFDPFPNWKGQKVKVKGRPELGEGTIQAVKWVGHWCIPGVEFDQFMENGHALRLRDDGAPGKEGHCLWVWLDNLEFIP